MSLPKTPKTWAKHCLQQNTTFHISTDRSFLNLDAINAAFALDCLYWAKPFPKEILRDIIEHSFCFGLYKTEYSPGPIATNAPPSPPDSDSDSDSEGGSAHQDAACEQIGYARLITDWYTYAYLTDVYVLPEYRNYGLGGWILDCVDELIRPLPYLRWFTLLTECEKSVAAYKERFGMGIFDNNDVNRGGVCMFRKGRANA
ncbi:hypothetical protein BDW74DRAFT_178006 [Aspergillus multicolor]|uniref:uncharacterized protein n=1 Tax=Aspergillus multicolor TaxID=41759 RepID=UPI003CCE3345